MAQNTKIEWSDDTLNLWWGCTKVHKGCDNCYAEYFSDVRYQKNLWGEGKPRKKIRRAFSELAKFQKLAASTNTKRKVFTGSMMDIFEKSKPLVDHQGNALSETTEDLRDQLFEQIETRKYPNLIFLFLTKRPSNINKMIPMAWLIHPPKSVWFGTSPVDQSTYDNLVGHLSKVKGNKFLSIEPQLDYINISQPNTKNIQWIIQGGESGNKRRPFELSWAYMMKLHCQQLGIPYFFKQIDKVQTIPEDLLVREFPTTLK